jgi:Carbohydrate binding module (family 6)
MRTILFILLFISQAYALDWQSEMHSGNFSEESHPTSDDHIRKSGNVVGYIRNGDWMKFSKFPFGQNGNVSSFSIDAAKGNSVNSTLRIRLDHLTGPEIGSLQITQTSGWQDFQKFRLYFSQKIVGTRDVYFICEGGNDPLFDLGTFRFQAAGYHRDEDLAAADFSAESHPDDANQIKSISKQVHSVKNGNWLRYQSFDFANGAQYLWMEAATPHAGGKIAIRVGSPTAAIVGTLSIQPTGSWTNIKPFGCKLSTHVVGIKDLYFTFSGGSDDLFHLAKFRFHRLAPDYVAPATMANWIKRDAPSSLYQAGSFTTESDPSDDVKVRSENGNISYISNDQWVSYENCNISEGANTITIVAASENEGGAVELRTDHPTNGIPLATIKIPNTGSFKCFLPFSANLATPLSGSQDLYLRFIGGGGYLFDIQSIQLQRFEQELKSTGRWVAADLYDSISSPGVTKSSTGAGISNAIGGAWVSYGKFHFGDGANLVTIMAATPNKGGRVEFCLDEPNGTRLAGIDVSHTGSWTLYREYTAALTKKISGVRKLYMKFVNTNNQSGSMMNVKELIFEKKAAVALAPENQGKLHVYDAVTGLTPSPYYTYSVQQVSKLNAPLKQNATNWESPFAWFSECKGYGDPHPAKYYSNELAGWSHTYCNFELGKHTPIVVKITRKNHDLGAPAGPIFMANAHPAHKVQSCEIINGDVYVTMKEPALVTVDIDGQMDTRDAPRSSPAEVASSKPYASKENGSHAVSIFANPIVEDKPVIGEEGTLVIKPGDPMPDPNGSWKTLYFAKGVHHFSRNPDGSPRAWKVGDNFVLMNNKTIYIPGDAMVFGNFDSRDETYKNNVRFYGHGTISGNHIPHYQDWKHWGLAEGGEQADGLDRPISMKGMVGCRFEGITLADPANHGISSDFGSGNARRWLKQISWRANSDMGGIPGMTEDCFFRLQDDGPYVTDHDFRRNTLWFDCNGSPFRGTFMFRHTFGQGHQTVMEDCDIIYVRSNWGGAVISAGDHGEVGKYPDGTKNTGQHIVFRNIRVTDPRPTRSLFGLKCATDSENGIAGMRFENIEFRHPHSWGGKSNLTSTGQGIFHYCYFDRVSINGRMLDGKLLADPSVFQIEKTSNLIFKNSTLQLQLKH